MKRLAAILFLLSAFCFLLSADAGTIRTNGSCGLAWDYPAAELGTNLVFKLYSSPDLNRPLTNWLCITQHVGTSCAVRVQFAPTPTQQWFYVTASNWWGESDPSNIVGAPNAPTANHSLRISP